MKSKEEISTNRLEAFSDGVIAIIITVMVFDLKVQSIDDTNSFNQSLIRLLPNFLSYAISFLMLAIMWVSHHQLFNEIKHSDAKLLWLNIHLLFWMSLVPFGTHVVGATPMQWESASIYSGIFLFNALAFTWIRNHTMSSNKYNDSLSIAIHKTVNRKNYVAIVLYGLGALIAPMNPIITYIIVMVVPISYFLSTYSSVTHLSSS